MQPLALAFVVLGLMLASSVVPIHANERDARSSTDPGIGCDAMTNLSNTYFGWGAAYAVPWLMTCIAYIESRWDPSAYNPSGATGLWQIMVPLACSMCDCSTIATEDGNAACANNILQSSEGLNAWNPDPSTCQSWLKYGGAPFDCAELEVPSPDLDLSKLDGDFLRGLYKKYHKKH